MPTSEKQIAANRRNAKKSTGPKTEQGKAASARNAIKHGLCARQVIVNSNYLEENEDDYEALLNSLYKDLKPRGLLQMALVRRIANCLWRSERAPAAETARINKNLNDIDRILKYNEILDKYADMPDVLLNSTQLSQKEIQELSDIVGDRLILDATSGYEIHRHESRLDQQLHRNLKALFRLQHRRKRPCNKSLQQKHIKSEKTNPFPLTPEPANHPEK